MQHEKAANRRSADDTDATTASAATAAPPAGRFSRIGAAESSRFREHSVHGRRRRRIITKTLTFREDFATVPSLR